MKPSSLSSGFICSDVGLGTAHLEVLETQEADITAARRHRRYADAGHTYEHTAAHTFTRTWNRTLAN